MKSIKKVLIIVIILTLFIFSLNFSKFIRTNINKNALSEKKSVRIRESGYWDLNGTQIFIDDSDPDFNWSKTANENDWCFGTGTWSDPYVIENITIDGRGLSNCIEIKNSEAYFIIRNCSFHNSDTSLRYAGLMLNNSNNGNLINNNCSENNSHGIFLFNCKNNTLSGNIANKNNFLGISLYKSVNNTLLNNSADGNNVGINIYESNNNTLVLNSVHHNDDHGIYMWESNLNTLIKNNISNVDYYGILLHNCSKIKLSGNLMTFCGIGLYGYGSKTKLLSNNIDNTNYVNGKKVYYYANETGLDSNNFTDSGQVILINCNNSIISALDLSNGTTGIFLGYSNNNIISRNIINGNYFGIDLFKSDNNIISENTANNNYYGLFALDSNFNNLSNNIANNNQYGLFYGICNYTTISSNNFSKNEKTGIWLGNNNFNSIFANKIAENFDGIMVNTFCNNNKIFLNYFLNNSVHNAFDYGNNNSWDNGLKGNYWDNYGGIDANDDGIGDTPYNVSGSAGSVDHFPIWNDGDDNPPVITINFPLNNSIFGLNAPNFNISINELNLDTIWYTFNDGINIYTNSLLSDELNQTAWNNLSEGIVTLKFYANDTSGKFGSAVVSIQKDISSPMIAIIFPLADNKFGINAPNYNLTINELNLDNVWYTIGDSIKRYFITNLTGVINQAAWDILKEGRVLLKFYANDAAGNLAYIGIEIIKDIPRNSQVISFGSHFLSITAITIISTVFLVKRKEFR
jgi:parallel beta-helix repeat protein